MGRGLQEALRRKLDGEIGGAAGAGRGAGGSPGRVGHCALSALLLTCDGVRARACDGSKPSCPTRGQRYLHPPRRDQVAGSDQPQPGRPTDDATSSSIENRRRLATALGFEPGRVVIGRQVHGAELAVHAERRGPARSPSPAPRFPRSTGT